MAVADEAEGLAEAQRRIAACRETRSESLDLSDLGLTRVPEEVMELDWLRELDLKNETVAKRGIGAEGARALSGLVNLTTLDLWGNGIGAEGARALSGLVNLTTLEPWTGNGIGAEGARALSGLVNLTTLDLAGNGIGAEGARALSGLVNLTTLDLAGNGVIDLSLFLQLQKLEKLDCSGCHVERAPPELWDMPSLQGSDPVRGGAAGRAQGGVVPGTTTILAWRDCALTSET